MKKEKFLKFMTVEDTALFGKKKTPNFKRRGFLNITYNLLTI